MRPGIHTIDTREETTMRLVICSLSLMSLLCIVILAQTRVASRADSSAVPKGAVIKKPWPHPIPLRALDPQATYTAELRTVWEDGTTSERKAELKFAVKSLLPREMSLAMLTPLRTGIGGGGVEINRALSGRPLSIWGQRYESGNGPRAKFEI